MRDFDPSNLDTVADVLGVGPDETVTETVELESAFWLRIALEVQDSDHDSVEGWLQRAAWMMLPENHGQLHERFQCDVHIDPETWRRLQWYAAAKWQMDPDRDPATVFGDTVDQFVSVFPNIVVNDESKGFEDVPGLGEGL